MLDLALRKFGIRARVSIKGAIAAFLTVLAVALPQLAHAAGGAAAGGVWMPMYAPALLAGCLLGWQWGLGVGILSPVASFGFTTLVFGNAMPTAERLPYMVLELAVFGVVSGLFRKKIQKNVWLAFPVVLLAQVSGRAVYVIYNLIAGKTFAALMSSVQTGLVGLFLQAILVPLVVIVLAKLLIREKQSEE